MRSCGSIGSQVSRPKEISRYDTCRLSDTGNFPRAFILGYHYNSKPVMDLVCNLE
jgi:hypothetical protein